MNQERVQGTFDELKGKVKRIWGELTDDELKKAEGSVDSLYGLIEKRFGESKDQIKRKIDQFH